MQYKRLEPIKGSSARVHTSFTKKAIRQIMVEEAAAIEAQSAKAEAAIEARTAEAEAAEKKATEDLAERVRAARIHAEEADARRAADAANAPETTMTPPPPPEPEAEEAAQDIAPPQRLRAAFQTVEADCDLIIEDVPAEKPRSFLGRLFGG
ncbi:hypothetical protein EI983_06250 [Roseovarius faecimaris]|uniref:Uncharacterized protein n=1 Tax=Roseovarius faecimaris TaxID=2494550 RepID=A0A6I6IQU2_9RHOB|nr:hypothetical protein [Roseovarius faecimaris]QGX97897.1 hypothetical protein EI983_06250 [Roseovarius faecimaris]